jgi:hypothetical protein
MAQVVSPTEQGNMVYLGKHFNYQLYRNSEGYIEGYKSINLIDTNSYCNAAKSLIRIVTNTKEIDEFPKFINRITEKKAKYNPYKDPNQQKLEL